MRDIIPVSQVQNIYEYLDAEALWPSVKIEPKVLKSLMFF